LKLKHFNIFWTINGKCTVIKMFLSNKNFLNYGKLAQNYCRGMEHYSVFGKLVAHNVI